MARLARAEIFDPSEIAIVHAIGKVVQGAYLLGEDPLTGQNFDHRKQWIESALERAAANFGIDLIAYSLMDTHMHLVFRSRPDIVATWDNTEVARRWLMLCPMRKNKDGSPKEPSEPELDAIRNDAQQLKEIRTRLSDISWWMRWLCQRIGQRANRESGKSGNFWQTRYRAVRLLDETAVLACAVYVDLNPIRAALAETIEDSRFTSARKRVLSLQQQLSGATSENVALCDSFLAPVSIASGQELCPAISPTDSRPTAVVAVSGGEQKAVSLRRCSDKGFACLSAADYLQLLDWTARQIAPGKRGSTAVGAPKIFQRLGLSVDVWCALVSHFHMHFCLVAGKPEIVDVYRSRLKEHHFKVDQATRELLTAN